MWKWIGQLCAKIFHYNRRNCICPLNILTDKFFCRSCILLECEGLVASALLRWSLQLWSWLHLNTVSSGNTGNASLQWVVCGGLVYRFHKKGGRLIVSPLLKHTKVKKCALFTFICDKLLRQMHWIVRWDCSVEVLHALVDWAIRPLSYCHSIS